jgi:AcrR family transcriptional regulator
VTESPVRRRDAAATRAAILASARAAFARAGYDGVGVREIANGAGVTAMLINRYFGSKEQLFAEVVAATMAAPDILAPENLSAPDMARRMATTLVDVTAPGATPLDGFLIMLRSASSDAAAAIAREQLEAHYHRTLTDALPGEAAATRAAVLLGLVAGVQIMRQMIGLSALTDTDPAQLAAVLQPLLTSLVGPPVC